MKKYILFTLAFASLCIFSQAQLVPLWGLSTGTFANGDAALPYHISSTDLIEGMTGTLISGGFHPATPGDDTSRLQTLTDGNFSSNGLDVIAQDYGGLGTVPGDSTADLVIEYSLASSSDVGLVQAFSGHASGGDRGWINMTIEMDSGSGYTTYFDYLKTGDYGQPFPNNDMVGVVRLVARSGIIATNVTKVRVSFFCVSHNGDAYFQAPYDDGPPANFFPNQGTILKEIDIEGPQPPLPTSAPLWKDR